MGGIYGVVGKDLDRGWVTRYLQSPADSMPLRGRDPAFCDRDHAALGAVVYSHESGRRIVATPDQSVVAACEGEIYNVRSLYASLKSPPPTASAVGSFDLVPYLYQEYDCDFPQSMNGVFGIALWDRRRQRLVLVRDHLGAHSLYYHQDARSGSITFATTIKTLATLGQVRLEVDVASLERYLASLAISAPHTIYRDIWAVPPGHAVIFQDGSCRERAYWHLGKRAEDRTRSQDDFAQELSHLLVDAVSVRAQHGGNCGALISGGVDTTAVAAALFTTGSMQRLPGFSVVFAEPDYSDAMLQQVVYDRFSVEPHSLTVTPPVFAELLAEGSGLLDVPINDVAYVGMLAAFRAAAAHGCEAVFEGEGSDEIFCTTHSFGEMYIQKYLRIPRALRQVLLRPLVVRFPMGNSIGHRVMRMLARIGMSDLERRSTWIPGFPARGRARLLGSAPARLSDVYASARRYYEGTCLRDPINIYQYGLTRLFLADDLLYKNERMAAGAGIVNRTPFVDYRLVEAAFRIPAAYKIQRPSPASDGTKLIFKKAMRGLVPAAILERKKQRGFSQPTALWFRGELREFAQEHLLDPSARIRDWLDPNEVRAVCSDFFRGRASNDYYVNSLLLLELWMRSHGI
jgi:asparagine synthase (glutamine-hydrolysing)